MKFKFYITSILIVCFFITFLGCSSPQEEQSSEPYYTAVYVQDGASDVRITTKVGEVPDLDKIPEIIPKIGYESAWSITDFSNAKNNQVIKVTVIYTPKSYKITFNSNGGSFISDSVTVKYGQSYDFSNIKPIKNKLTFVDGWYLGENKVGLTGVWEFDCSSSETLIAKYCVSVTFKQAGQEDILMYFDIGDSVTKNELPKVTPVSGYIVNWSKLDLAKLDNLTENVTVNAIMQDASWSPNK